MYENAVLCRIIKDHFFTKQLINCGFSRPPKNGGNRAMKLMNDVHVTEMGRCKEEGEVIYNRALDVRPKRHRSGVHLSLMASSPEAAGNFCPIRDWVEECSPPPLCSLTAACGRLKHEKSFRVPSTNTEILVLRRGAKSRLCIRGRFQISLILMK